MADPPAGVLAIWQDIAPEADRLVNDWYNQEHHPERVDVPGFHGARRYEAVEGAPRYFIRYATTDPAVLGSPAYLERLNHPTPRTREAMPFFRNNVRTVFRVAARYGRGEGGCAATWRFAPAAGRAGALEAWLREEALPGVLSQPGLVSAELWQADRDTTTLPSEERALRGGADEVADWALVVTANRPEHLQALRGEVLSDSILARHGAEGAVCGIYRLVFALDA